MAALAFALVPAASCAQSSEAADSAASDPVVITATRTAAPVSQQIHPVTVITGSEIELAGQQSLTEVLRARGGLQTGSTGGYGQPSSVFLRGANSAQTLVLLDGIRINGALTGTTRFETIPNEQLARIEIVPGPLSSLYGSEAIGGVIQMFTHRWPDANRLKATAGYGSYNTSNVHAGVSAGTDKLGMAVDAGYFATDGFSATNATEPFGSFNPDRDDHVNSNFSGSVAYRFAPDQEVGISAFYTDTSTRFDFAPGADDRNNQILGVYSAYADNRLTSWWQSILRVGTSRDESETQGTIVGVSRSDQLQTTWQNTFFVPTGTLVAGFEYLDQSIDADTSFIEDRRQIYSVFGGYVGQIGNNTLQASVRNDDYSTFGNQTNFSLGYGYRFSRQFRLRASGGTGFHAPTFSELYDPFFGNPSLQPEKSRSWEVGGDVTVGRHAFAVTYFNNRIDGLIVFDGASSSLLNLRQARIEGFELGYDGVLLGLDTRVRLTLQDPHDEQTGALLPRRSKEFGSVTVMRRFGRWQLGGEVVGSGERFDSPNENPATRLDPYALLNLLATYTPAPNWTIEARWDNVFDTQYEFAKGYNTAGSTVFVSVRYQVR